MKNELRFVSLRPPGCAEVLGVSITTEGLGIVMKLYKGSLSDAIKKSQVSWTMVLNDRQRKVVMMETGGRALKRQQKSREEDCDDERGGRTLTRKFLTHPAEGRVRAVLQQAPPPMAKRLKMLSDLCLGVVSLHDNGIIHRDLKVRWWWWWWCTSP